VADAAAGGSDGGTLAGVSYALRNLRETEDSAPRFGLQEVGEAHFPREELGAETIGMAYHVLRPGRRSAFGHRHEQAEEVYVVLSGSGRVRLDDEIVDLGELDALRVAPSVARAFEAGDGGMSLLVFGPRHAGDGEIIADFWPAG
jgi:mannose-6-phosphate isomerase-like protein (cupin superfamily)